MAAALGCLTGLSRPGPWGLSGWLFYQRGLGIQQTGLILVIYTLHRRRAGAVNQPRMFVACVAICFAPLILRIATDGGA